MIRTIIDIGSNSSYDLFCKIREYQKHNCPTQSLSLLAFKPIFTNLINQFYLLNKRLRG